MSQKYSFRQRFGYWFDNLMAGGTRTLLIGLFVLSAIIIFLAAALVKFTNSAPNGESLLKLTWMGLLRTLDSGTMGSDQGNFIFLSMMFFVTLGGVFVVSALIGILNNGLEAQLDHLRKGRSQALESGHTVILGWTPQIFTIISELVIANENRTPALAGGARESGAVIVIMADQDKVEMEDAIRERIPEIKNTRVICRSGSPIDLTDIEIVSPHTARSIIVLPEGEDPDSLVIKSVLALTNNPKRHAEPYHIVTQIRDPKNMDVVKMIGQRDIVQPVLTNDLIARVVAQTSRQSGLSIVYTELMNFGGDEIYFKQEPALTGKTFDEALQAYEDSALMGLRRADGATLLNPPMETDVRADDQLIAISADDDTIKLASAPGTVDASAICKDGHPNKPTPEKSLILGWNRSGAIILRELDSYVPKGSLVTVVSDLPDLNKQFRSQAGRMVNQKVEVKEGDTTERALLEELGAAEYDHVIVLADSNLEHQEADARTLVTLLHLRDIAERDATPFSIVSEMLDLRNRELAEAADVDDFIVSDHLVSLMMTQLSENHNLLPVFTDLFDPEGAEIYLKPISDYVEMGRPVNFYTVAAAAGQRGETAIGYRLLSESDKAGKSYGVHTNPRKSEMVIFAPEDKIIVIAED